MIVRNHKSRLEAAVQPLGGQDQQQAVEASLFD